MQRDAASGMFSDRRKNSGLWNMIKAVTRLPTHIREPHYGAFLERQIGNDDFLDLPGIHVFSSRNDHVFEPVYDEEVVIMSSSIPMSPERNHPSPPRKHFVLFHGIVRYSFMMLRPRIQISPSCPSGT